MSNGCSICGMIWNTCDSRPLVKLIDGKKCIRDDVAAPGVAAGDASSILGALTLTNEAAANPLTALIAAKAVQKGLLFDKCCLPSFALSSDSISALIDDTAPPVTADDAVIFGWFLGSGCDCGA